MRYWWYVLGLAVGALIGVGIAKINGSLISAVQNGHWVTVAAFLLVVAAATAGALWAEAADKKAASPVSRTPPS